MTPEERQRRRYKYLSDEEYRRTFRVEELPPQPWKYTLTTTLVQNLMRVADVAGQLRAAPLSYYRQKELAEDALEELTAGSSPGRVIDCRVYTAHRTRRGSSRMSGRSSGSASKAVKISRHTH